MKGRGTPVNRVWVVVTRSGVVVIDWGDGIFQDVHSGEFLACSEGEISHHILDDELEMLKRGGKVDYFDAKDVYFNNLPERHQRTIE
jgi:hypothetical protein